MYQVGFGAADDDGSTAADSVTVLITGMRTTAGPLPRLDDQRRIGHRIDAKV